MTRRDFLAAGAAALAAVPVVAAAEPAPEPICCVHSWEFKIFGGQAREFFQERAAYRTADVGAGGPPPRLFQSSRMEQAFGRFRASRSAVYDAANGIVTVTTIWVTAEWSVAGSAMRHPAQV